MRKNVLAIAATLAVTASGLAHAGLYVGAGINYNEITEFSVPDVRSSADSKVGFGVNLGYDYNFGGIILGAEVAMQNTAGATKLHDIPNDLKMDGEVENTRSFNVKLGYEVVKGVTPYLKLGRGTADLKLSVPGLSSTSSFDTKTIGAGLTYDLGTNLSLVGEYRQLSNLDGTGDFNASTFDAGVMYRF